ncbi:MAG: lipopolysaccharide assembly protein LapA domain-containing protein [Thermodesulfobacteriota bacterium]
MTLIKIFLLILLIIVGATFCALNRQEIILRYFFGWSTGSFPLFLLIIISLLIGSAIGLSLGWGERRRLRGEAKKLQQRIKELKQELEVQSVPGESNENKNTP